MTNEAQIRDALAERLDLIEEGMTLVKKEFHLTNVAGTGGFIDILAADKFGHSVVIEIKKSNKTAREAIHELFKYVALLKVNHKLSNDRVRCILLSTEWRELLVPFSEFAREAHYHADGYQLLIDQKGLPKSVQEVELMPEGESLSLCPHHKIFLYSTEARRDSALPYIEDWLKKLDLSYIIVSLTYRGNDPKVIYRFAHYLVITPIPPEVRSKIEEEFSVRVVIDPEEVREPAEWEFEDEVLGFIGTSIFPLRDDTEIGYPEKFVGVLQAWEAVRIQRHGKGLNSEQINSNEFIVTQIMGLQGENTAVYHAISSPRFKPKWVKSKDGADYCLIGNENWRKGLPAYLDEVAARDRNATVSISVYNPCNTILSLYKLANGEYQFLPALEIAIEEIKGKRLRLLLGWLTWDGRTHPQSHEVINDVFGDLNSFFMSVHFGDTYVHEERVIRLHGLTYSLFEFVIEAGKPSSAARVKVKGDKITREPIGKTRRHDVIKFASENKSYLSDLVTLIAASSKGF